MRARTKRVSDEKLREFIDDKLSRGGPKEWSISYLVDCIRFEGGMTFPTHHTVAMNEFERLGYRLESDRTQWGALLRTYVRPRSEALLPKVDLVEG